MTRVKSFEIINFSKEITLLQKIQEPPLMQDPLSQPVLSVESFTSDLLLKNGQKFSATSKGFPKSIYFSCEEHAMVAYAEKISKTGFLD